MPEAGESVGGGLEKKAAPGFFAMRAVGIPHESLKQKFMLVSQCKSLRKNNGQLHVQ